MRPLNKRVGLLVLVCCLSAPILPFLAASSYAHHPLVGFVNHFPWIDHGMDRVSASGSNAVIFRAVAGIEDQEGRFNFESLDRQIEFAEKHGLRIVLLIEANPIYAPAWLKRKCQSAGEMQITAWGKPDGIPSMTSKVFAQWHRMFVERVIDYVRRRDRRRVVVAYQPGAEWWYSAAARYNPADLAEFKSWLARRYGRIEHLNAAWRSDYTDFDQVEPSYLGMETSLGTREGLTPIVPVDELYHDVSWSTHEDIPITGGKEYIFRARYRCRDVRGQGIHLEIGWRQGRGGVPVASAHSENRRGTSDWGEIVLKARAPDHCSSAWLLLKLKGNGRVDFDDIFFAEAGSEANLAPNADLDKGVEKPDYYYFDNWTDSPNARCEYLAENANRYISIQIPRSGKREPRFRNWSAVSYDWSMFSYEFLGDYIEAFCKLVKECDPSRLTVGYLTYSFAFPVEWDQVQESAMALDVILPKLKHLDVIGMQICSADGDPVRITAALDLARKYRKPMFAIDLLDFTSGVAIGYPAMHVVTQTAIQHGATGAFYYCWYGTPDYNFYTGMPLTNLEKMLTSARRSMDMVVRRRVQTRVAVVEPILPSVFNDTSFCKNSYRDFVGLYKAVLDLQLCPDVWTLHELDSQKPDLKGKYDAVFLPDCAYCPPEAARVLKRFADAGGQIIYGGSLPMLNAIGDRLQEHAIRGVSIGRGFGSQYLGSIFRTTHAGNTPPLFVETGDPGATRLRRLRMLRKLAATLDRLGVQRPFRAQEPGVGCTVFVSQGRKLFFVTNRSGQDVLKNVRISPGPGWRFAGISGGVLLNPKRCGNVWTSNIATHDTSCMIEFRTTND